MRFAVRVTPRGGRDAIGRWEKDSAGEQYLALRVRAPAEDGKANDAVLALLKEALGVKRAALSIASGAHGRRKLIEVAGEPGELTRRLERIGREA